MLLSLVVLIIVIISIFFACFPEQGTRTKDILSRQLSMGQTVIVSFRGKKYDITNFVRLHPGGKKVLLQNNGRDIEQLMLNNDHSKEAYKILEKYIITENGTKI